MANSARPSCLLLCACVLLAGCGGEGYSLAVVEGRITDQGQPVAGASVTYHPIGSGRENPGPASFGVTDGDGRYVLRTYNDDRPGAVVGRHQMRVSTASREPQADFAPVTSSRKVPKRFQDGSTVVEVPAGGLSSADFDLSAP